MIDEQWNSPLKVKKSHCSVKTLVCHYTYLWCAVHSTTSLRWECLFSSSSLKGHYGMRKPGWPKAKYIIFLLVPGEHTWQIRLTPVRMLRIWTIFQMNFAIHRSQVIRDRAAELQGSSWNCQCYCSSPPPFMRSKHFADFAHRSSLVLDSLSCLLFLKIRHLSPPPVLV